MSAFVSLPTPMTDRACLLAALADLGFGSSKVEVHDQAQALHGYEGDAREQQAHIIIRRQHVGSASNDLGFEATPVGYRAHISDFDSAQFSRAWLAQLRDRYQHHAEARDGQLRAALVAAEAEVRRQAELEARRREEARLRLIESQRQLIQETARKLGYRVEESRKGEKLQLVLVKRTY